MEVALKHVVTCAEMARMCCLSRSRFYGLVREGIMPQPSRNPETGRPFYSREQQEQCLQVRRTNCGVNGKPILFYSVGVRQPTQVSQPRPSRTVRSIVRQMGKRGQADPVLQELIDGLEQLGMAALAPAKVRAALAEIHPDGHQGVPPSDLLASVFRHLTRQD